MEMIQLKKDWIGCVQTVTEVPYSLMLRYADVTSNRRKLEGRDLKNFGLLIIIVRRLSQMLGAMRSRTDFLKFQDHNSSWFHHKANVRSSINQITELMDANGNICTDPKDLQLIVVDYFKNLFSIERSNHIDFQQKISSEMNEYFCQPYHEAFKAFNQMHLGKAPGSGDDVTHTILNILNGCNFPHRLNYSHVVLFPKKHSSNEIGHFKPDSKWVPRSNAFKILTPVKVEARLSRVGDLLDQIKWIGTIPINSICLSIDIEAILSIPLCPSWLRDKLTCHYSPENKLLNQLIILFCRFKIGSTQYVAMMPNWGVGCMIDAHANLRPYSTSRKEWVGGD
ncbi:hypothetical protein Cgig2_008894 [Carnegiea gigantea]|uniref:Uncharacterized protein n=1 Tax=Carnegiea gigantea TaxID=171969 RepID=A0A9Q1QJS8_9CARY|nr:hypothetical protein Cgig2_008894 [Carnegiea gigantea]